MSTLTQKCSEVQPSRPQVARDPLALAQLVTDRIEAGSPFTTARSAWAGFELIGTIAGMYFSFAIHNFELSVRATDTFQLYGCLPVGRRLERGRYESLVSRQEFYNWLGAMLGACPIPELPAPNGRSIDPEAPLSQDERFELDELRREQDGNGRFTYDLDAVLKPDKLNRQGGHYRNFNNPHRHG